MKNETARREIESLDYYLQNHTDDYSEESHTAMMMAIKALEQEPFINKPCVAGEVCEHDKQKVLDKIRAEIEFEVDHRSNMLCAEDVFQIIDKYKAETEQKE